MWDKQNINLAPVDASKSFVHKEGCIYRGLLIYLGETVGEYLSGEQIGLLADSFRRLRNRPADVEYSDDLCCMISGESEIRNRFIPHKMLRKDEGSVLFYNLAPYALIGRKQTARFAKRAFPNFFASTSTINSTFTKFSRIPGSVIESRTDLSIKPLADHSIHGVEEFLYNLGINPQAHESDKEE